VRWFIVFLIVANVILFFWVQQESRPRPADVRLPPPDVGRLRLLTEMRSPPAGEGAQSADRQVGESPDPGPAAQATASSEVEPALAPLQVDTSGEVAAQAMRSPEVASSDDARLADPAVPDQRAAVAEESAAVVGEAVGDESRDGAADAPAGAGQELAAATATACARVGPLPPGDADQLVSSLPPNMVLLSDVAEEYTSVERYYVIIPPMPSSAAGQTKMQELADAGVTDTWLFRTGEYRNGISLGFFSRKGGAQKRAENVAKKGFNTEIKEQGSVRERRWLLLKYRDGDDPGQSLPLPAGVRAEVQSCP
jgi:hypothetical protein